MKRLILLRHAKAEPAGEGPDHSRDLAERGLQDASWAGQALAEGGWMPALALVSDARRTQHTFERVAAGLTPQPRLQLEPRLYEAAPGDILALIKETPASVECLLVVGHNPGLAQTALQLSRSGQPEARSRIAQGFPTAALAIIDLEGQSWAEVARGGTLKALLLPPR